MFCGIDWAEGHHDIAIVDEAGTLVAKKRIPETTEGWRQLLEVLADAGDSAEEPIPVAIETPRGLLVAALRATQRLVYAINPMAVARYRERHTVSRSKSDHVDAMVLANVLRTDAHAHRALPADTDLARAIAVLARAHQDATWRRARAANRLRSLLREYYPAFLDAFVGRKGYLTRADARAVLAAAPTPAAAATLDASAIAGIVRQGGRKRGIVKLAAELDQALQVEHLRQPGLIEEAMGAAALALLATLDTECANVDQLGAACSRAFAQHSDYEIITSFPGLSDSLGARVLAELGDDRTRFANGRAIKAYAGSAPVTRASGRSISVTHRHIKNNRLATTGWAWAFAAAANSAAAREHYKRRREHFGDRHPAALRNLFNRYLGCLFHCLATQQTYDETKAFPAPSPTTT